eukprot:COSAG01_NODE_27493_length_684_cov_1.203419_1_plen_177_part_10
MGGFLDTLQSSVIDSDYKGVKFWLALLIVIDVLIAVFVIYYRYSRNGAADGRVDGQLQEFVATFAEHEDPLPMYNKSHPRSDKHSKLTHLKRGQVYKIITVDDVANPQWIQIERVLQAGEGHCRSACGSLMRRDTGWVEIAIDSDEFVRDPRAEKNGVPFPLEVRLYITDHHPHHPS